MAETDDPSTETAVQAQAPARRGCLGTIVSGGCGCFAFLVGAGAAIAFFAPQLLSGWGARVLENVIESQIDGRARVDGLYLSWGSEQNAKQVDIFAPGDDDKPVMTGSIDFPSILSILGWEEGQRRYEIRVERFEAQLDEGGSSDLARVLRVDPEEHGSLAHAWLERVDTFVKKRLTSGDDRSVRVTVRIVEGVFKPFLPSQDSVVVDKLEIVADNYRREPWIEIKSGKVRWNGSGGEASVSGKTTFGIDEIGDGVVASMKAAVDPIPVDVLRTLGVLERGPEGSQEGPDLSRRANAFDSAALPLLAWAREYAASGVGIEVDYEAAPTGGESTASDATPGPGRLEVELSGEMGEVQMLADVVRDRTGSIDRWVLSGDAPVGATSPFRFELVPGAGIEARFLGLFLPDAIHIRQERAAEDARVWGAARSFEFRVPVGAFGDSRRAPNGRPFGAAAQLADILRQTTIDLTVASRRGMAPRVALVSSGSAADSSNEPSDSDRLDELELVHHVSRLELTRPFGGELRSDWGTTSRPDSSMSVHFAGARISREESSRGRMNLALARVPRSFIDATLGGMRRQVLAALPDRLERVELSGLPLELGLGVPTPVGADVFVQTTGGEVIEGRFDDGVFLCSRAHFDLLLEQGASKELLLGWMPWLSDVEPRSTEQCQLDVVLEDFEFRFLEDSGEDSGTVLIKCPPLRVKLEQNLAARLGRNARERAGWWLDWNPKPMSIRADRHNMFYDAMELPLPGGGVAAVTGNVIGREYRLAGDYPGSYVAANLAPDKMFSAELYSSGGAPRLTLDPIDLKVTDIARIIEDELTRIFLMKEKERE